MNRLIQFLLFLMTPIGLLAGLSLAGSIGILFILLLVNISFPRSFALSFPLGNESISWLTPAVLMLLWCVISSLWAPDFYLSLKALIGLLFFVIATLRLLSVDQKSLDEFYNISQTPLLYGLIAAIILFFFEYYSGGVISTTFKTLIQHKNIPFELPWLDRGVVFISLLSWFVINNLLKQKQYMLAISIYISIIYTLYLSDSLAGFIGFVLGGLSYIMLRLTKIRLGLLMRICFALYIIAMPIMAYKQDPLEISNKYSIPDSAKHRLFIWSFASHKIADHPIAGYGFSSSNHIATENDVVHYGQYQWCLLPLHPHNNVLQILLETGLVGFILFILLVDNILKWTIRNNNPLAAACFINYFFIGTISFGIWQSWWLGVGALMVVLMRRKTWKELAP